MTILRKPFLRLPLLALLPLLPLVAQTEPPATGPVAVACEHRYISQRDAARVLRTDNFSQTYAKRQSLYANVARLCHSGVSQVLLVVDEPQPKARTVAVASR